MNPSAIRDFPDWLSPILVKELRQGLRSRAFTLTFVATQLVMMIYLMAAAVNYEDIKGQIHTQFMGAGGQTFIDGIFWFLLAVPLLVILPLRAASALSDEIEGGKLDVIQLTRLGAAGVVLGKWVATNAVTLLFVIAVSPYLLARYFLGFNTLVDLANLGILFGISVFLSSLLVGYSGSPTIVRRLLAVLAVILGFVLQWLLPSQFFFESFAPGGVTVFDKAVVIMGIVVAGLYWCLTGVWKVGKNSTNWYLGRRLLLPVFGVIGLWCLTEQDLRFWAGVFFLLMYAGMLDEFQDDVPLNERHVAILRRVPGWFRWAFRWVYPGWIWAVFYLAVMVFVLVGSVLFGVPLVRQILGRGLSPDFLPLGLNVLASFWMMMLLGVAVSRALFACYKMPAWIVFSFHLVYYVVGVFAEVSNQSPTFESYGSIFFPVNVFVVLISNPGDSGASEFLTSAVYFPLCAFAMMVFHSIAQYRRREAAAWEQMLDEGGKAKSALPAI